MHFSELLAELVKMLSVCVCLEVNPDHVPKKISLTYFMGQNHPLKKLGVNRHFQGS